jgi:hypothetical protein
MCTGRGRKAASEECAEWDWQHSRQQVLLAVLDVMRTDLRTLFKGLTAAERMVNLCMELVRRVLQYGHCSCQEREGLCSAIQPPCAAGCA